MPKFEPVLLARIDKPNSTALAGYKADGGYIALEKALAMKPDDVTNLVKDGNVRPADSDDIIRDTLLTQGGEVVNTRVRETMGLPALMAQ